MSKEPGSKGGMLDKLKQGQSKCLQQESLGPMSRERCQSTDACKERELRTRYEVKAAKSNTMIKYREILLLENWTSQGFTNLNAVWLCGP